MNSKTLVTRTVVIFAALAIAGLSLAASSRFLVDLSQQSILIGIGSAMFGAALTFFLIRVLSIVGK